MIVWRTPSKQQQPSFTLMNRKSIFGRDLRVNQDKSENGWADGKENGRDTGRRKLDRAPQSIWGKGKRSRKPSRIRGRGNQRRAEQGR
ncbi:hypothetical protein SLA2020_356010 [Shorea laevis]